MRSFNFPILINPFEIIDGDNINFVIEKAKNLAKQENKNVGVEFNQVFVIINKNTDINETVKHYFEIAKNGEFIKNKNCIIFEKPVYFLKNLNNISNLLNDYLKNNITDEKIKDEIRLINLIEKAINNYNVDLGRIYYSFLYKDSFYVIDNGFDTPEKIFKHITKNNNNSKAKQKLVK